MSARPLRRAGALCLAGATGVVLAGCGAVAGGSGEASGQPSDVKACVVTSDGGFQDRSFNQGAHDGLRAAARGGGVRTSQAESRSAAEFEPNLRSMVQQGCALTVSLGHQLAATTQKVAAAHPERHFAVVDDASVSAPNVTSVVYRSEEAAFLAGYLAAGTTKTGSVGTFGGVDDPAVRATMDGFADGVRHYNEKNGKDVAVLGWNRDERRGSFLGSFHDAAKAKKVTQDLVDDGADVVLPVAGQAAQGAADTVVAANRSGHTVRLIWPDTDGYEVLPAGREYVLTSVLKGLSASVEDLVTHTADGTFTTGTTVGTLGNGGVGLAPYHDQQSVVGEALDRQVRQLKQDVIGGRVRVRSDSTGGTPSP